MEYQRCTLGLWDTSIPDISFDEKGVSNYANLQKRLMDCYPRGDQGKKDLEKIIQEITLSGKDQKYDCIVGISGGTDSCYLLHCAVEWGLRPLAVNVDNGFNTKTAVENIKKMTSKLNIELTTYILNYDDVKIALGSYMRASLPWIDCPTDLALKSALMITARKNRIKYILNGQDFRTEGKQPYLWTAGDDRQFNYLTHKLSGCRLKNYPVISIWGMIYYRLVRRIRRINPFFYIEYNKTQARQYLMDNYQWEYYGEHHHENLFTKFTLSYWLYEKFKIDKRIITYSAQVLNGDIAREEALELLSRKPYSDETIESEIDYILKKLSISREEFKLIWKSPVKYLWDYPTRLGFVFKHQKITKFFFRYILKYNALFLEKL